MNMNEYIPKQQGHSVKGLFNLNFSMILQIVPTCNDSEMYVFVEVTGLSKGNSGIFFC